MEPNYENSTAAAKGCYWNERPFSNENERNTHNSTLPDINLLSTKNGLDFGVHLKHPLVSEALITISGSVRNTATLLEVLVAMKITPVSGLDPANA